MGLVRGLAMVEWLSLETNHVIIDIFIKKSANLLKIIVYPLIFQQLFVLVHESCADDVFCVNPCLQTDILPFNLDLDILLPYGPMWTRFLVPTTTPPQLNVSDYFLVRKKPSKVCTSFILWIDEKH